MLTLLKLNLKKLALKLKLNNCTFEVLISPAKQQGLFFFRFYIYKNLTRKCFSDKLFQPMIYKNNSLAVKYYFSGNAIPRPNEFKQGTFWALAVLHLSGTIGVL